MRESAPRTDRLLSPDLGEGRFRTARPILLLSPDSDILLANRGAAIHARELNNLGNLWRRLVLPNGTDRWSLTSLQQRLVTTGGRLIKHA